MTNSKTSHFYILPDGRPAINMKDGSLKLGIGGTTFRSLIKKGKVKKIIIKNPNAMSNEQKINYNIH